VLPNGSIFSLSFILSAKIDHAIQITSQKT